jgi:hypothetical protein
LKKELDEILNKNIKNSRIHFRFHDWFYTNLYRQVEDSQVIEFNHNGDLSLFSGISDVKDMIKSVDEFDYQIL